MIDKKLGRERVKASISITKALKKLPAEDAIAILRSALDTQQELLKLERKEKKKGA